MLLEIPDEVLVEIFTLLDANALGRLARTSRDLRRVSEDAFVRAEIIILCAGFLFIYACVLVYMIVFCTGGDIHAARPLCGDEWVTHSHER